MNAHAEVVGANRDQRWFLIGDEVTTYLKYGDFSSFPSVQHNRYAAWNTQRIDSQQNPQTAWKNLLWHIQGQSLKREYYRDCYDRSRSHTLSFTLSWGESTGKSDECVAQISVYLVGGGYKHFRVWRYGQISFIYISIHRFVPVLHTIWCVPFTPKIKSSTKYVSSLGTWVASLPLVGELIQFHSGMPLKIHEVGILIGMTPGG